MKYTTTSLIEVLKKFPKDLPIDMELSMMFNYPEELKHLQDTMSREEFLELTREHATNLVLFEGSWEGGTISHEKVKKIQEKWNL